jgi:hypothetical protein
VEGLFVERVHQLIFLMHPARQLAVGLDHRIVRQSRSILWA